MDKLRATLFRQVANRVQAQRKDTEEALRDRPTISAGGGFIQRLGGVPFRPSSDLRTAATGSGRPVLYSDGIALGSPSGSNSGNLGGQSTNGSFNGQEQVDLNISSPEDRTYVVTFSSRYRAQVTGLFTPELLPYVVTVSPAVGTVLELGAQLTITLSGISEATTEITPLSLSIELRRLQ